jgi:hypothetical protein
MKELALGFILLILFIFLLVSLPSILGMWKVYKKAGKEGWASIVPIYNFIVLMEIVNKPAWWVLLLCIPIVNIYFSIVIINRLSLSFGKDTGFTIGLLFFPIIFQPILGFDTSVYRRLDN